MCAGGLQAPSVCYIILPSLRAERQEYLSSLSFKMGSFDTTMLPMLLCQKAHLLCVPYSPCHTCDFHLWVGCGEGQPLVPHFLAILALQHEVMMPAVDPRHPLVGSDFLPSLKEVNVLEGKKDGHQLDISAWLRVPRERCQHHPVRFASLQPPCTSVLPEPSAPAAFSLPYPPCSFDALSCLMFLLSFPASPHFFFLWDFSFPLSFRLPVSPPSRHFRQQEFQDMVRSCILY